MRRLVWTLCLFLSACLCEGTDKDSAESPESDDQASERPAMDPATFKDILPTYTYEYRSPNPKDTKFTSGGIYQGNFHEKAAIGSSVKCDLKMGVYSYNESARIDFIIIKGNELNHFRTLVSSQRVRDFVFMDITTIAAIDREVTSSYLLTVIARDADTLVTLDETLVNVTVVDFNDHKPKFSIGNRTQIVTVREDIPLHSPVLKLKAVDTDAGLNGLVYYSFKGKTSSFAMNPATGEITTTRPLNSSKAYQLKVVARDRGPESSSQGWFTCIVHINVRAVNKFAPAVKIKSKNDNIPEGNTGVGIVFAVVKVVDKDNGDNGEIDKLVITSGNEERQFAVRSTASSSEFEIEVVGPLDREKQPYGYNLTLAAFDKGSPPRNGTITVRVVTLDINDNAPTIHQSKYSAKVSEMAPPQTPVVQISATDGDAGSNAEILFAISKGNDGGNFSIDPKTGVISTTAWLDYQDRASFDLEVTALDGGQSRKWTPVPVHIEVEDANNNDPVFSQSSYTKVLYEGIPSGEKILTITATDGDSGDNGRVQYHITNQEPLPFAIDPTSGTLSTLAELNRDEGLPEFMTIKVRASDFGTPLRREAETYIHVTVKSRNDKPPVFKQYSCDIRVSEDAPIGTEITTVTAIDVDVEKVETLTYSLSLQDDFFHIGSKSGTVKTKQLLQRSQRETLFLEVEDGIHRSSTAVTLNIKVVPRQDAKQFVNFVRGDCKNNPTYANASKLIERQKSFKPSQPLSEAPPKESPNQYSPSFIHHQAVLVLREDAPVGTMVSTFTAVDRDQGYNGLVVYSITAGNTDNSFVIDTFSGEVTTVASLDREKTSEFTLTIAAFDRGNPARSTSTTVKITVTDVNDNAPVFDKAVYGVSVLENATVGQTVINIQASDADDGVNGFVKYQLADNFGKFDINERGLITIMANLDYEEASKYDILVQALDTSPTVPRISSAIVHVKIVDINDTPPKITPSVLRISIPSDIPSESLITSVHATDPDRGQGGKLTYSVMTGGNKFKIDARNGVVRSRRKLDYSAQNEYNVTVKVTDNGLPSLYSLCYIIITLQPVEKNSLRPVFKETGRVLYGSVLENQMPATTVQTIQMSSSDPVKYSLIDGTGLDKFTIHPETGLLVTSKVLDYKEADHYWLVVQAKTGGIQRLYSNIHVLISVVDVTDEGPYFKPTVYYPSVLENKPAGTSVVQVMGHDSAGSKLMYSITSGNHEGLFSIDNTGLVTTTAPLDREVEDKYILSVYISDGSNPPKNNSISFMVTVADDNDHAPLFVENGFEANLLKLNIINHTTELIQVAAKDDDIGTNAELTYAISERSIHGNLFNIDPHTGVVTARQQLPFDEEFYLFVNVTDGGRPPRFSEISVTINFLDENPPSSNPPQLISQQETTVTLQEDIAINKVVKRLIAFDPDGDIIFYSIVSGNVGNKFRIEFSYGSDEGEIKVARRLDYEAKRNYVLKVEVTDGYNTVTATLNIIVSDVNDNAPQPVMMEYHAHVAEAEVAGKLVTKVEAKDPDTSTRMTYLLVGSAKSKSLQLFKVNKGTGEIKTRASLDYEDMHEHVLTIKASDNSHPVKETLFYAIISVDDVNDHKPVFVQSLYEAEVNVGAQPGLALVKVLATDKDTGSNARLKYSVVTESVNGTFYIDQNSGMIHVASELTDQSTEYEIKVKAMDGGAKPFSSYTTVKILVRGIGALARFDRPEHLTTIPENSPAGYAVAVVNFNATMPVYNLVPKEAACWQDFQVDRQSGVLVSKVAFDAEKTSQCKLTVHATSAKQEGETDVIVTIQDKNDNAPQFTHDKYVAHVTEDAGVGSAVIGVDGKALVFQAVDLDSGVNSQVTFEIVGCQVFSVDSKTGRLITVEDLNYEKISMYTFKVKASDSGTPSLSSFADVEVHVRDVNDEVPVFSRSTYDVNLYLPAFEGTKVATVVASDADSESVTNLEFSLASARLNDTFDVNAKSGVVTVKSGARIQFGALVVRISVSDGKFSNSAFLSVNCKTLPQSSMRFTQPSYAAKVLEGPSTDDEIFAVQNVGYSVGETLTYSIVNPSDLFVISPSTGIISTVQGGEFDRERGDQYVVVVQARDAGTPPRIAQVPVYVSVEDVNDNKPKFSESSYFFVVQKGGKIGSWVGQVTATDDDIGSNGEVRYVLKSGSDKFDVQFETGIITVLRSLDAVVDSKVFKLLVEARDTGNPRLRSEVEVQLKVVDKETPIFDQSSYYKELREDSRVGMEIAKVHATSPGGADIFYAITQGNPFNQFSVDLKTGSVTIVAPLDYESTPRYKLTVRATDAKTSSHGEVDIDVRVTDVNDFSPIFNQSLYLAKISEAVSICTSVLVVPAFDEDSGINQQITYSLQKHSDFFSIDANTSEISVAAKLDYEAQVVHDLVVVATDGGSPSMTGEARVRIVLEDANDNPPKFNRDSYDTAILGSAGPGYFVTRLIATDADENDAGRLRYSITSGEGQQYFHIDPTSGVITLSKILGIEQGKVYNLDVAVTDNSTTARAQVRVVIGDTNQHSPVFSQDVYKVVFHENYPPQTFVMMVAATDKDSGNFSRVTYSIDSLEAARKFRIDAETGMIYSRMTFDREVPSHAFTHIPVRATDGGGRFGFCAVEVSLSDDNDNQPVFEVSQYEVSIPRTTNVGGHVLLTSARDADAGTNGKLTYTIIGHQTPPLFHIEANTGIVKVARQPSEKTYKFYVLAKDGGSPMLYATVPVTITVLKRDAHVVQFDRVEYQVDADEDVGSSSVLTTVRTSVVGVPHPGPIHYKIIPGILPSSKGDLFSVNSRGEVKTDGTLDYETMKRYVLIVEANATSFNQVGRATVVVKVKDVNDNKPAFVSNPYKLDLPENIAVGSSVLRVFAEDVDEGTNGQLTYDFSSPNQNFAIDGKSGWITTTAVLDREAAGSQQLSVSATDASSSPLTGLTVVNVNILDVNDSPPQFTKARFLASVKEDALIGQEVTTVTAKDADLNPDVYFFIMSGDPLGKFGIERKTGKVFVDGLLDRETVSSYMLNVSASDGLFTSFTDLKIDVLDVNDNTPVCARSMEIVRISEVFPIGNRVLTVTASDADEGENSKLTYTVFGEGVGSFVINQTTGDLETESKLDRETKPSFNFMVSAVDKGGLKCFSNITIHIDDVNDNTPKFTQVQYSVSEYENARVSKVLLQVKADDADLGVNRKISYSLLNDAQGTFSIEKETGMISLEKPLNRETHESYTLTVKAQDGGSSPLSSTATVMVLVLNINDVPPEFETNLYVANVSEEAQVGTLVAQVHAISKEAGPEQMSYAILPGPDSNLFKMDTKSGKITLRGALDYEKVARYSLTVQASDVGPPVLTATATVSIEVTDANDNKPVFRQASYRVKVDENSPADKFVVQVFASDKDSGSNKLIRYSIVGGNEEGKFKIDAGSGVITVAAQIDREMTSSFTLTARAQDHGSTPLAAETQVIVDVNDLNDNPPEFSTNTFQVSIKESSPTGTEVIRLLPDDKDTPENGKPFSFVLRSGGNSKFKLYQSGLITTDGMLDHRYGEYLLTIRVQDNGGPPQFTDVYVRVRAQGTPTHPPSVQPLNIYLNLYNSQFNGGVVGRVKGEDRDGDSLTFSLVQPSSGLPFEITREGTVRTIAPVISGIYHLNVSVSDSVYRVFVPVKIDVSDITDDILEHSITLRLANMGPGTFVEKHFAKFRNFLGTLMSVPSNNVRIWSLQSSNISLDVVFAIRRSFGMRRSPRTFHSASIVAQKLNATRGDFERKVNVKVAYIGVSQCPRMQCAKQYECRVIYKPENEQIRIMSDKRAFISYEHSRGHACVCSDRGGCSNLGKCASAPCPSGYKCLNLPKGYVCQCDDASECPGEERGCVDKTCIKGTTAASFGGGSYLRYKVKIFDQPSRSLSMAFKTWKSTGTLVYAAGDYDYSILEIVKGSLQLRFDFGSGAGVVSLDWYQINDGNWHHVTVERQGNHATVILDQGRHRASGKSPGAMRILNLDDDSIYFGAKVVNSVFKRDTVDVRVENGFDGCMQNLNLNGQDLPLTGSSGGNTADVHGVTPGCQTSGDCKRNPCALDRKCVETFDSYLCECLPGHSGIDCKASFKCVDSPCRNGGTCLPRADGYSCSCPAGYTGLQCHVQLDACASSPCRNGGTCKITSAGGYQCQCPERVTGSSCEVDKRPCASAPCYFGGNCSNNGAEFICSCRGGYSGKRCENGFHCSKDPCKNGGACNGDGSCGCAEGFTGPDCSQDKDECLGEPCKNGGTCKNTFGGFQCNCSSSSYGGPYCEDDIPNMSAATGDWPLGKGEIIGIGVFLFIILLIVILAVIVLRRRARRRKSTALKVSPPVMGSDVVSPNPPTPPPRQMLGYEDEELSTPPMYDSEDSWRRQRAAKEFGSTKVPKSSDANLSGYSWDFADLGKDSFPLQQCQSACASHEEGKPEVPQRPRNYRLSECDESPETSHVPHVPHVPKKPALYVNPRSKGGSRYSMDGSEISEYTDIEHTDVFRGRFPRPPRDPYPESLDQYPVGSYAPTMMTGRESELESVADFTEDDLERVYLGNRLETCDDSPENTYLHSETCSDDENEDDCYDPGPQDDVEFHKTLQREIKVMMDELEDLKMESEL